MNVIVEGYKLFRFSLDSQICLLNVLSNENGKRHKHEFKFYDKIDCIVSQIFFFCQF